MKYDMNAHLPQQVENLLNGFAQGDAALLERIKTNIKDIVQDKTFLKDMDDYDKRKLEKITELMNKAKDAIKTMVETKNPDELFVDAQGILNDLTTALGTIEGEYWDTIKSYVIGWMKQLEMKEEE